MRKGANIEAALKALQEKVKEMNDHILPAGVKIVPFLDRSDLIHFTTHTVLHNLAEGFILVTLALLLLLGNIRGALIVALTIPFSLLFASICLDFRQIPANLLSLGALDFGMVVEGTVVMVENIIRHVGQGRRKRLWQRAFELPRTKCRGRSFIPLPLSLPLTFPSLLWNGSKAVCSDLWPGRLPLLCSAR